MKSKTALFSILAIVFAAVAAYFIYQRKFSTLDSKNVSFAVLDVSVIKKIVITEPEFQPASIEKNADGVWMVNDLYRCREDNINVMLEGIRKMRIKYPVPNAAINNVLKDIATTGIKVEIYDKNEEMIKAYYLGKATPDMGGNNALLIDPKSGRPYETPIVIEIPGFYGYITPRFFANVNTWRDVNVFSAQIKDLKKIEVMYTEYQDSAYTIDNLGNNNFTLRKGNGEMIPQFDTNTLKRYLVYYRQAAVYNFLKDLKEKYEPLDSVSKTKPYAMVRITTSNKPVQLFEFFRQPVDEKMFTAIDPNRKYDPEYVLVRLNEPKEFAIAQYTNIGLWLQTWSYFLPEKPVKN